MYNPIHKTRFIVSLLLQISQFYSVLTPYNCLNLIRFSIRYNCFAKQALAYKRSTQLSHHHWILSSALYSFSRYQWSILGCLDWCIISHRFQQSKGSGSWCVPGFYHKLHSRSLYGNFFAAGLNISSENKKEEGSRKSLRVCHACWGYGLYESRYTKLLHSFFLFK